MSKAPETSSQQRIEALFREEYSRILAVLIRQTGDFDLAEEGIQEALASALERWPIEGTPARPDSWIYVTAKHKVVDAIRRRSSLQTKYRVLVTDFRDSHNHQATLEETMDSPVPDERLRLIFTCCHPALSLEAQVALTLKTLGGLTTREIAQGFVLSEATLAQRLVRAKNKVREAGIPFVIPSEEMLPERLEAVLAIVYLIFNEGYHSSSGDSVVRRDLTSEAIRLGRVLLELMPGEAEVIGLLALMLLHDSRKLARVAIDGHLVMLEDQDRSLWDREEIQEGLRLIHLAGILDRPGPYQIQAFIASLHARARKAWQTDWKQIVALYRTLREDNPSPVLALNEAAAMAMAFGPEYGLALLSRPSLADSLVTYRWFHTTKAELLRKLKRRDEALQSYHRALELCDNSAEKSFLVRRIEEMG